MYLERLRDLMNPYDSQGKDKKLKIMELAGGKAALDAIREKQTKQVGLVHFFSKTKLPEVIYF